MPKHVLVVDDDLDQRSLMRDILDIFGFQAVTAANGHEALQYLMTNELPGLIFLDITMPVMSGREFLATIYSGSHPELERIPVVVVSAVTDFVDLRERYNCVALIRKPIPIDSIKMFAEQFAG